MKGPAVELVLLLLLVLFFGIQQRSRPQRYFRFWFVGWLLVLLSYVAAQLQLEHPAWGRVLEASRTDLVLAGALTFLMSFVAADERLMRTALRGCLVGVPVALLFNAQLFWPVPRLVLGAGVLVWHLEGLRDARLLLPANRPGRRIVNAICVASCIGLLVMVGVGQHNNLTVCATAEVLLCTAVLYGSLEARRSMAAPRSMAALVGAIGFGLWAAFYPAGMLLANRPMWLQGLYDFWQFPKYFVGFSMVLKVFETTTAEKMELAEGFQQLYEDFRLLYESHPHPMWIYNPGKGEAGKGQILSVNKAALEVYGFSEDEFLALGMEALEPDKDVEIDEIERLVPQPSEGRRTQHRYKDGRKVWTNVVEQGIVFRGQEARLVLARDISHRLQMNRQLAYQAHHDPLTGLPNRALLQERLEQCLAMSARDGRRAAVLSIDVDHFKRVNDTHGHMVGDDCLKAVAERLQSRIRQMDTIARTGGEEFMAVVGRLSRVEDARKVASGLLRQFDQPLQLEGCELGMTVSIGVAIYPDDGLDVASLRRRSDEALYEAKRRGRNCVVLAAEMEENLVENSAMTG
jgi:diguanylate cyclase (GGDEF)-like protein/PAS domain S-box-containing protein